MIEGDTLEAFIVRAGGSASQFTLRAVEAPPHGPYPLPGGRRIAEVDGVDLLATSTRAFWQVDSLYVYVDAEPGGALPVVSDLAELIRAGLRVEYPPPLFEEALGGDDDPQLLENTEARYTVLIPAGWRAVEGPVPDPKHDSPMLLVAGTWDFPPTGGIAQDCNLGPYHDAVLALPRGGALVWISEPVQETPEELDPRPEPFTLEGKVPADPAYEGCDGTQDWYWWLFQDVGRGFEAGILIHPSADEETIDEALSILNNFEPA